MKWEKMCFMQRMGEKKRSFSREIEIELLKTPQSISRSRFPIKTETVNNFILAIEIRKFFLLINDISK